MLIDISKANPEKPSLSEDPEKFCNDCQKLAISEEFTKMIKKFQGTILINSSDLALDENANIRYDILLTTLEKLITSAPNDIEKKPKKFINKKDSVFKKIRNGLFKSSEADAVLDKAVKCAIGVDPSDSEHKKGKCIDPVGMFKTGLQKIIKLIEPSNLYEECHMLLKSRRFTKMIGELQNDKIPIDAKDVAAKSPQGTVSYLS
jgi:hypothetical protein